MMTGKHKKSKFINRELSWLEFNQRVLDEALDEKLPLLERLKFLAITDSNLDEFFMVRVGGLQYLCSQGKTNPDPAGLAPAEQLEAIHQRVGRMVAEQNRCFLEQLEPQLAAAGILRVSPQELSERQYSMVRRLFENEISAVLTPIAVDAPQKVPLIFNLSLHVCVRLEKEHKDKPQQRFAIIPLGQSLNRVVTLESEGGYAYMLLEDIVAMFAGDFFPEELVQECVAFRITRNADFTVREDLAPDLMTGMEEILDARKTGHCARLQLAATASDEMRQFFTKGLGAPEETIYDVAGPIDLSAFFSLADLPGFESLKYEPWPPLPTPGVDLSASIFEILSRRDVLLYHPYESFDPVVKLIEEAADDPDVLAIKQTLYRTSPNSPIVAALRRAAERGKYVTAIVELKARFDEARNIEWAKNLERASVQVIYGVKGLKTHAKVCIIVRREPHGIQRYVHFGTGNYNEATARVYSDVSYITSNEELGADASSFFNAVTGFSQPQAFRKIEAAPMGLRERLLEMIDVETQRKEQGQKAHIVVKLNALVDSQIIQALYRASQAGVTIKLNVRGICCLRPGVKGLSEKIEVISIIDRYLEHARIFYFYHGGDERVFISSADWMPRNLDRRVELLVPVEDPASRRQLISTLDQYFQDNMKARRLLPDGSYERVIPKRGRKHVRSQQQLYEYYRDLVKQAEKSQLTVFEPHRAVDEEVS